MNLIKVGEGGVTSTTARTCVNIVFCILKLLRATCLTISSSLIINWFICKHLILHCISLYVGLAEEGCYHLIFNLQYWPYIAPFNCISSSINALWVPANSKSSDTISMFLRIRSTKSTDFLNISQNCKLADALNNKVLPFTKRESTFDWSPP